MPTKKLIEVALPLDAINAASAREKSIRHGHPSTLHLWWARRPLAACRAVLFASLIDDPDQEGVPEELLAEIDKLPAPQLPDWDALPKGEQRRQRLFRFIEELVQWENSNNERVLRIARRLIHAATGGSPPPVYDPFAGGGSIPLEAQRLGLEAHASDLNPVAVLINKALIEIPPKFANMPPVNPIDRNQIGAEWKGAAGLAADVRYYGKWMRDEAERRIGHLYPKVKLPKEYGGGEATVIAWLWARTVKCPNPACGARMPLVSSFEISRKRGNEAWIAPGVERDTKRVHFEVHVGNGKPPDSPKLGRGARFRCLVCGQIAEERHIKSEAKAGRMDTQLMAIVAEGQRGRIYLSPSEVHERIAAGAQPDWAPTEPLANDPRNIWCVNYGLDTFDKLFTRRQLVALTTFSDLVSEARERVRTDSFTIEVHDAQGYADAVTTYLAFAVSKATDLASTLCRWQSNPQHLKLGSTFSRQALPMTWDYAEGNAFSDSSGNFWRQWELIDEVLLDLAPNAAGRVQQEDATQLGIKEQVVFSTDPPYYDNISYADLRVHKEII